MTKKIILFPNINKKHILPFSIALFQIILMIVNKYYPNDANNGCLEMFSTSLGQILVRVLPCFFNISHSNQEKRHKKKRPYIYYLLLIIIQLFNIIILALSQIFLNDEPGNYVSIINAEFLKMGLEMILLIILSKYILKYKFFKHHIIAIFFFIFFGVICDITIDQYKDMYNKGIYNFIDISSIIINSIYFCYIKYLMENILFDYWNIALANGLLLFFLSCLYLIYILTSKNSDIKVVKSFYTSIENENIAPLVIKQVLIMILYFFNSTCTILTSYYFDPCFILISYQFSKFYQVIVKSPEKAYCIIFFLFQFFCLMILLEIIELNFWNLNKNTRRNIEERGLLDINDENRRDSSLEQTNIDFDIGYYIMATEDNKKKEDIEMRNKDSSFTESMN